ncbi:hypothetical protein QTP86_029806 [Hemibagrus guttatus]|nr:hypothetical protein QTP86_029806 [Hemibagrus guttatus]
MLKDDRLGQHVPTLHPNSSQLVRTVLQHMSWDDIGSCDLPRIDGLQCAPDLMLLPCEGEANVDHGLYCSCLLWLHIKVGKEEVQLLCQCSVTISSSKVSLSRPVESPVAGPEGGVPLLQQLLDLPARRVWKNYLPAINGIVFLVDCVDHLRLPESKTELDALLTDETIGNVPVLILGNKIDKPEAISEERLREMFGLYGQTTGKGNIPLKELNTRPLEVFMCSVLKREGYGEGFRWLSQYID